MFEWNSAPDSTIIVSTSVRTDIYFTCSWRSDFQFAMFPRWSLPGIIRWRQCSETLALALFNTRHGNYELWWSSPSKLDNKFNISS